MVEKRWQLHAVTEKTFLTVPSALCTVFGFCSGGCVHRVGEARWVPQAPGRGTGVGQLYYCHDGYVPAGGAGEVGERSLWPTEW